MPLITKMTVLETLKKLPNQKGNSGDIVRKMFAVDYIECLGLKVPHQVLMMAKELQKEGLLKSEKRSNRSGYIFTVVSERANSLL